LKKLLHIVATPRSDESRTLQISQAFLDVFNRTHQGWVVELLDLTRENLPSLTMKRVDGKYVLLDGKELYGDLKEAWQEIIAHIERFNSADAYLLSTPMWNFSIPYFLKHYIDIIVQPKFLFRYTPTGVEGLVKGKKMMVIISRGGDYSSDSPEISKDFQKPYLRSIFGFVGLTDMDFIIAQPMDIDIETQKARLAQAKNDAIATAEKFIKE